MFITLWLGIYNKNTNILTFSNAGHDAPLIKKDNKYEFLDENKGIVLGILEDFEFVSQKIDFIEGYIGDDRLYSRYLLLVEQVINKEKNISWKYFK